MHVKVSSRVSWLVLFLSVALLSVASPAAASRDLRLVQAVKNQDTEVVRALLEQGIDVNTRNPDGATALLWTAQWDDLETADLLIRAGADVNAANDFGVTPLSMACTNRSAAMVDKLLKAGANPNAALPTGETPLMTAALTGNVNVVNALLARGVDVNAKETSRGQTALMWAVSEKHLDVARSLIEHGADASARSNVGFTPLMFAARQGDLDAVKLLLASGGDVNESAEVQTEAAVKSAFGRAVQRHTAADGSSVLHVATVRGHVELAKFLLDQGANPNVDGPGYTALHWAVGTWESVMTRDYQVESGEWSVLGGLPTREGKLGLIQALLAHGADVNARLKKSPPRFGNNFFKVLGGDYVPGAAPETIVGATPFALAAMSGDVDVMRLLVANGADPLLALEDQTTPLMLAAGLAVVENETRVPESSHLEAVRLCLELGADIGGINDAGNTALHATAFVGLDTIAQFLVDKGAPLNVKNKKGETPLKIAEGFVNLDQVYVHQSTADLLRKLGGVTQ